MRALLFLCALSVSASAWANFPACILDDMPGAKNDIYAQHVFSACYRKYPGGNTSAEALAVQGSRPGFFSFKNGAECTLKKTKDTTSPKGASIIRAACFHLYDPPPPPEYIFVDPIPIKE